MRLLVRDDDVDVVVAAQAMVGDGEQAVGVGRQVDAHTSGLLFATTSRKPGSWCVKPLWSCRQTRDVISRLSDATSARQGSSLQFSSHLACWLNIESMTWTNAS